MPHIPLVAALSCFMGWGLPVAALQDTGMALDEKRMELEAALPSLGEHDWPKLAEAQARFSYLAKWQTQVRELLLKLM